MYILATVHLPYTSGLPEDEAINTFAVNFTGAGELNADLTDVLVDFYTDTVTGTTGSMGEFLSEVIDRTTNACRVDLAEIEVAGPPGSVQVGPIYYTDTFTLSGGSGGVSLPLECAMVASFRNTTATTDPVRRRRGRIYVGPLSTVTLTTADGPPMITDEISEEMAARCLWLATSMPADTEWSVWSRAEGVLYPVDSGFVNNEFDTQRRRGVTATARENWTTII